MATINTIPITDILDMRAGRTQAGDKIQYTAQMCYERMRACLGGYPDFGKLIQEYYKNPSFDNMKHIMNMAYAQGTETVGKVLDTQDSYDINIFLRYFRQMRAKNIDEINEIKSDLAMQNFYRKENTKFCHYISTLYEKNQASRSLLISACLMPGVAENNVSLLHSFLRFVEEPEQSVVGNTLINGVKEGKIDIPKEGPDALDTIKNTFNKYCSNNVHIKDWMAYLETGR